MKKIYKRHLDEVMKTIKMVEVEEKFDIYFSRFFGLYFAKLGKYLRMTPTHVSLISLVFGVIGGGMLYFQDELLLVAIGGGLIVLAGVLDSADGQLARMTGQSSEVGRVVDGLIDNLVFAACYIGGALYFLPEYGWLVFVLGAAAGYAQSYKQAVYEFYKSEFLFLAGRMEAGYIPVDATELKPRGSSWYHKLLYHLYLDYTKKQLGYTTRTKSDRELMQQDSKDDKNSFRELYASANKKLLFWWSLLGGSNVHRNAIIISALFGRFDIYLWASLIWTIGMIPMSFFPKAIG